MEKFEDKTVVTTLPCTIDAASIRVSIPSLEDNLEAYKVGVPGRHIKIEAVDKDGNAYVLKRVKYFRYEASAKDYATVTIVYTDHKE